MSGGLGNVMFTVGLNDLKGLFQTALILWFTGNCQTAHRSPGDTSRLASAFSSLQNLHVLPRSPHNHCQGLDPQTHRVQSLRAISGILPPTSLQAFFVSRCPNSPSVTDISRHFKKEVLFVAFIPRATLISCREISSAAW